MVRCGAGGGLWGVGMREWQAGSSGRRRHDSATAVSRGRGVGGKAGGGEGRGVGPVCRPTQCCGPSPGEWCRCRSVVYYFIVRVGTALAFVPSHMAAVAAGTRAAVHDGVARRTGRADRTCD